MAHDKAEFSLFPLVIFIYQTININMLQTTKFSNDIYLPTYWVHCSFPMKIMFYSLIFYGVVICPFIIFWRNFPLHCFPLTSTGSICGWVWNHWVEHIHAPEEANRRYSFFMSSLGNILALGYHLTMDIWPSLLAICRVMLKF